MEKGEVNYQLNRSEHFPKEFQGARHKDIHQDSC
jgi:hypothetical protein